MVLNRKDMVWIGNESVRKMWASVRKWSKILEMAENCQEMVREWFFNDLNWSEMGWNCLKLCHGPILSKMIQDGSLWSKMVQDGLKWSMMAWNGPIWSETDQDGPRFQNGQRCLKHWKKYTLHTYGLSAEGAKAGGKKEKTLDHPPHFYCSIFFLCSFLFSLFKSFHLAR